MADFIDDISNVYYILQLNILLYVRGQRKFKGEVLYFISCKQVCRAGLMQATCSTNDLYVYQINIVQSFSLSSLKEKLDSFEDDKTKV